MKIRTAKSKNSIPRTLLWSTVIIGTITGLGILLFWSEPGTKTSLAEITVYKSPTCNCCEKWIDHLRDAGFKVTGKNSRDMNNIKSDLGVGRNLQSCHTAIVDGYVIEGHVPANDIKRLLQERPEMTGLTVPGMPRGSPGMESQHTDPFDVLTFDKNGQTRVYASY
jgi:hypothetical protein